MKSEGRIAKSKVRRTGGCEICWVVQVVYTLGIGVGRESGALRCCAIISEIVAC